MNLTQDLNGLDSVERDVVMWGVLKTTKVY